MRFPATLCASSALTTAAPALAIIMAALGVAGPSVAQDLGVAPNAVAQQADKGAAPAASGVGSSPPAATLEELTVLAPAMHISPSDVPLNIVQPTSTVPSGFIANNIIPLASYDDIIKFQPSVWVQNPNGPGIGKFESLTLRGFQDSQYNVTFDGIPFQDATDLHHTSSAMFIAHDLGQAEVDRGPGTASTIGNATFGGTVGFVTKPGADSFDLNPYGTYGGFDTRAEGIEIDSGPTAAGRGFVDFQHEETNGYLTGSAEQRTNVMVKDSYQLNADTTLTFLGTYNRESQNTTQGATLAEYQKFGDNYGLCSNKALQCYAGYNPSKYYSDFEYVDLSTKFFGVKLDDKVYTDGFGHSYTESTDASDDNAADNGVTFYSAAGKKLATDPNDVPGKLTNAHWRAFGNILRLSDDTPWGTIKAGFWFDQNHDGRYSYSTDLTQGDIPVDGKTGTAYSYNYKDVSTTYQPYLEFDWTPLPGLVVTPGVRYSDFYRRVDAILNKSTKEPLDTGESFHSVMPSIAANYTILHGWTVYAQAAKGFQAPGIDVFQVQDVVGLKPETTWSYQIGTAMRRSRWMLGADVYNVNFSNYLSSVEINVPGYGTESSYVNSGGAIYQGVELEGQYALGLGFSLYGNYSYNSAKYKGTSTWIAEVPEWLSSVGLLYDNRNGPYFSVIGKLVGPHYGLDGVSTLSGNVDYADQYKINDYFTADMAFGWVIKRTVGPLRSLTPSIKIGNLFDSHVVTDFAGNQSATSSAYPDGAPLYWRQAGRSVFFNLSAVLF